MAKRPAAVSPIEPGDLTLAVVADHLGVHPETIGRMARTDLIPARRVPGKGCHGTKRIRRPDLAAAIDKWTVHAERTTGMTTAVIDIPDVTDPETGLPKLWPLADVAKMVGRSERRLRERINRKEFAVIRVSPYNLRMSAPMIRALLAQLTDEATADTSADRDRKRADRQRGRTATPKPRRTAT